MPEVSYLSYFRGISMFTPSLDWYNRLRAKYAITLVSNKNFCGWGLVGLRPISNMNRVASNQCMPPKKVPALGDFSDAVLADRVASGTSQDKLI
jgi:hypothetical protein